jgi:purine-nucleoside phosphorylase
MNKIPTPHIEATSQDEIAKVVLMPGDPLRAKKVAETYLDDVKLFNQVRGMLGYTGIYQGKRVSVMGSGMGFGSIGIYSYELYAFYDVDTIIRIGSCGAATPDIELLDIVLADEVISNEAFAKIAHGFDEDHIKGSQRISALIRKVSAEMHVKVIEGNISSSYVFYATVNRHREKLTAEHDLVAHEMEAFALFANAKALGKEAACLLTVSGSRFAKGKYLSSADRQNAFDGMIRLSLTTAAAAIE